MLFGRRDKKNQSNERVLNLKARVDALRQADEASRTKEQQQPYSLDQFLEGDDVLTGREIEDRYKPPPQVDAAGDGSTQPAQTSHVSHDERSDVDLEAELRRYLERQEEQSKLDESAPQPAPAPVDRPQPGSNSLLLDGTWSRDDDVWRREPPPPSSQPAPSDRPLWLTPFPDPAPSPPQASPWPDSPDSVWPNSDSGSDEDEEDPGREAV